MTRRILLVVSNVAHFEGTSDPTGRWLSELTHAYDLFAANGYEQTIMSPKGGISPLEPRSLKWPTFDSSANRWYADAASMSLLSTTARPDQIGATEFDAIYLTGGHAVVWDFPNDEGLQRITRSIYEQGGVVAAVCHGYCGLRRSRPSASLVYLTV